VAELRRMRPLLGTFVEIGITQPIDNEVANAVLTRAFGVIELLQALLSFQNPDSELSQLNRSAAPLLLHPLTVLTLRLARGMTHASGGLFNCTVGGLLIAAGVLPNHADHLPLQSGNADDIAINGRLVRLRRPVQITVDGIAKGLAVDLAARAMRSAGISAGWINAGGDLLAFGTTALRVQRRELNGRFAPLGMLRNGAIASSAVNATPNPRFPGHIVNVHGTAPAAGVWSVHAASAWRADALTKVAALTPSHHRAARIHKLGGTLMSAPSSTSSAA
jgi:FAD:protein FMN transferase